MKPLTTRQIKRRGYDLVRFHDKGWRYGHISKRARKRAHGQDAAGNPLKLSLKEEGKSWMKM